MSLVSKCVLGFLLLTSTVVQAQDRRDWCGVYYSWTDQKAGRGSGLINAGEFRTLPAIVPLIKSYRHEDSDRMVTVGVEYIYDSIKPKSKPSYVRLAIAITDKEESELFNFIDTAEAQIPYNKHWVLSVAKKFAFNQLIYTYNIHCIGGRTVTKK